MKGFGDFSMRKDICVSRKRYRAFSMLFLVLFVGLAFIAGPLESKAQTGPAPDLLLTARLTGEPLNGVRPRGAAAYTEFNGGAQQALHVAVDRVRLPNGAMLDVSIDGSVVGQIRVRFGGGVLRLATPAGDTVPDVSPGSTIAVTRGDRTIVGGEFGEPPAPAINRLFAPLEGAPVDGIAPRGVAHYAESGGDDPADLGALARRLAVFVHRVNLPEGTSLSVSVDGVPVGSITLNEDGDGGMRLSTANGDTVPEVQVGSELTVDNGDASILAGTFQEFDRPVPPRFRRNRLFGGRMNGSQMVPPVETMARGKVLVVLNRLHKKIAVKYGFRGLSGDQTTAAIHGPAHRGETAEVIFDLDPVGGTQGVSGFQLFDVTPEQIAQLRTGHWYIQIASAAFPDGEIRGQIRGRHRRDRFLGDETADIAVYRTSNSTFYVKNGSGYISETIGQPGDKQVSGDFDGDGTTDFAVFGGGRWEIRRSSDGGTTQKQFGSPGDIPSQGDFDGDGSADLAVFRPSTGYWYIQKSGGGIAILKFGTNGDAPVASDFDGDGITDIAVFRESNGTWHWLRSSDGGYGAIQFGTPGDTPIVGDFDGDGADDVSVFRNSTGVWYSYLSSNGGYLVRQFGVDGDIPSAADYDGDGITDYAVFRSSDRTWHFWKSSTDSYSVDYFGAPGDLPTSSN